MVAAQRILFGRARSAGKEELAIRIQEVDIDAPGSRKALYEMAKEISGNGEADG